MSIRLKKVGWIEAIIGIANPYEAPSHISVRFDSPQKMAPMPNLMTPVHALEDTYKKIGGDFQRGIRKFRQLSFDDSRH